MARRGVRFPITLRLAFLLIAGLTALGCPAADEVPPLDELAARRGTGARIVSLSPLATRFLTQLGLAEKMIELDRPTAGGEDDRQPRPSEVDFSEITYGKALLIGLFQSIAIVPGVSRSAATIVGGSLIGISKRTIVEFSFMLAVPTMLAASALELFKNHSALAGNFGVLGVGFVVSFITAIAAIKSFLSYLKKRDFTAFGWYRIILAVVFYLVFVR